MAKKSFKKNNPALQFISTTESNDPTQEESNAPNTQEAQVVYNTQKEQESSHKLYAQNEQDVPNAQEVPQIQKVQEVHVAYNAQEVQREYEAGAKLYTREETPDSAYIRHTDQVLEKEKSDQSKDLAEVNSLKKAEEIAANIGAGERFENAEDKHAEMYSTAYASRKTHTGGTQGKKGQKLPRINMAFSEENLAYLQLMARIDGCSMTEYVNRLVAADNVHRQEEVERFSALLKK